MIRNFIRTMVMSPEGEISASNAPEVKNSNAELYSNVDPNETFDDLEYESEASKKIKEEYNSKFKDKIKKAKEATKKEQVEDKDEEDEKPKKKEKKTEIDTLSDKSEDEEVEEKPKKKEEKKAKEEDKEEDEPELEAEEEEKPLEADKKGKLKLRMSDGLYPIESDAKVRVKVDGDFQEVPIQELINNYSGKTAWDKKFTEIGMKNKEIETRETQVTKTQEFLKQTVSSVVQVLNDPNKNPYDALQILVEKAGADPYTLWRRSLENSLDEIEKLQSMSEEGRKAYFLEKKDEFRTKAEEARKKAFDEETARNTAIQKVDALRQAHGVSEEQFMKAWDDLEAEGTENPTDEQIVDRASISPHLNTVQDILEPFEDQIDDSKYSKVVTDFARQIRAKEITPEQLKEIVAREFQDEDLKDLTVRKKATPKPKEVVHTPKEGKKSYDSFDDFLDD